MSGNLAFMSVNWSREGCPHQSKRLHLIHWGMREQNRGKVILCLCSSRHQTSLLTLVLLVLRLSVWDWINAPISFLVSSFQTIDLLQPLSNHRVWAYNNPCQSVSILSTYLSPRTSVSGRTLTNIFYQDYKKGWNEHNRAHYLLSLIRSFEFIFLTK